MVQSPRKWRGSALSKRREQWRSRLFFLPGAYCPLDVTNGSPISIWHVNEPVLVRADLSLHEPQSTD